MMPECHPGRMQDDEVQKQDTIPKTSRYHTYLSQSKTKFKQGFRDREIQKTAINAGRSKRSM